ncbi:MAG: CusA/CzcA family heavy metal efflux RND transporter [Flavobacteriales bacterium]|nr:CusA/CzcA family heavy metal efflux RND transporter [Flavobacteriales bacterium]
MIDRIITFSVRNKLITGLLLLALIGWGAYSVSRLPIDALPDVTNNQVLVNTIAPNLATQEVEKFITFPLEQAFKNLPDVVELRSVSRSGLSVITVVFKDALDPNLARQWVGERILQVQANIPPGYGTPEIAPPTTGTGEIYQYTLAVDSAHKDKYDLIELRTLQDWVVRQHLLGVPGVIDVSSFGGLLKQYEVSVDARRLAGAKLSLLDVFAALQNNNSNTGGSYIEKGPNIYFIRGEGLVTSLKDMENIVVSSRGGSPVRIRDVAEVRFGHAVRYGALTRNGEGEAVGGVVLMLKGANALATVTAVKERMVDVQHSLPEGVHIDAFVDRAKLVNKTIGTVEHNLLMGALIVIGVLILLLGNWRAGLIVATVIPLALLFAISCMVVAGQSANLMSMGALDFGLIVDGAVIVVEGMMFALHQRFGGQRLSRECMDDETITSAGSIMKSAVFGQVIILIVYVPIFALIGVEGKMFRPMAFTVSFAIIGALILSLTYVPWATSIFLSKDIPKGESWSERMIHRLQNWYAPKLRFLLHHHRMVLGSALLLFLVAMVAFDRLGGEFIPELDEGDFATNVTIRQGSNLSESIQVSNELARILMKNFPEVKEVVGKIGSSEIPTDPMPIESQDLLIVMKDKDQWVTTKDREHMADLMSEKMNVIPGLNLSFEQPIQMRFNELIAGVKSDIAVKIYGDDLDQLFKSGNEVAALIGTIDGATDIKVEQVVGMPQLVVNYDRERVAQYGLNIADLNRVLNTALAGGHAGVVYEGERRFDLVVRLADMRDADADKVKSILVPLPNGAQMPLGQLAEIGFQSAPAQVSRENGARRIVVETNVRGRDIQSVAKDIQKAIDAKLKLPTGYFVEYGGTFKNLEQASARLMLTVPLALALIFILLFFAFGSVKQALIIFSAVPLAAVGGVFALSIRSLDFSISAGIGFIALFGVAVLNGIVLISYFDQLERSRDAALDDGSGITDDEKAERITERVISGTLARLRPVLATAAVASLGFLPMALSNSEGSEVQRPLATVVIGGLISSTLLTLVVLPVLYHLVYTRRRKRSSGTSATVVPALLLLLFVGTSAQAQVLPLDSAVSRALRTHPTITAAELNVQQQEVLRRTAFQLNPINAQYQHGQINSGYARDFNLQATTGIDFPTVIAQRAAYLKESLRLAEADQLTTRSVVKESAGGAYLQWTMAAEQIALLQRLDTIYSRLATYADRKFEVGQTGRLEKVSAQSSADQIAIELRRAEGDLAVYQAELERWTGGLNGALPDTNSMTLLAHAPDPDVGMDPVLLQEQQRVALAEKAWKLERSQWAPSLQGGGFYQSLDGLSPFSGYLIGASMPLPGSGQGVRTKAARLRSEIAQQQFEDVRRTRSTELIRTRTRLVQLRENLAYYEGTGTALASTLRGDAERAYLNGDVGYMEFIQGVDRSYRIDSEHLRTRFELALTLLHLKSLQGQ